MTLTGYTCHGELKNGTTKLELSVISVLELGTGKKDAQKSNTF